MAPIASCPPPRLASKDAGAGEARYEGVVNVVDLLTCTCLHPRAFLPAPVGNAGTGAVTQVQAIRGLY